MKLITMSALCCAIVCSGFAPNALAQESQDDSAQAPEAPAEQETPNESDDAAETAEVEAPAAPSEEQTQEQAETEEPQAPAEPEPSLPEAPEIPEPPSSLPDAPSTSSEDELSLSDWERDDWMLLQPELSLVELNGYFRVRSQMFRRLNFGNSELGAEDPSRFEVNEEVVAGTGDSDEREDVNLAGTDLRLRLEPVINVTERVQVITTIDILDNLVMGSTPLSSPFVREDPDDTDARRTPVNILNRSQASPQAGVNYVRDAILIRRAYARLTALNDQLQFDIGR
ncbi:MAG: hypothetical protein AAFY60_19565, partial [Myxococcota bacterium]